MSALEILREHIPTPALGTSNVGAGGGSNFRYCKCGEILEATYAELGDLPLAESNNLNAILDRKIAEHQASFLAPHIREQEALALEHVGWTLTAQEVGDARRTVNNSPKYMGTIMEPVALILQRRAEQLRGKP